MTASPELPVLSTPSGVVAACAPLLGYQPRDCVVGFIGGVPGRAGAVLVRVDLVEGARAAEAAERLADSIAGTGGDVVDLVAWVADPPVAESRDLSSLPMLERIALALAVRDVTVRTMLSTDGQVWWSHDCPHGCCRTAVPLDGHVLTEVRAEFAYAGYAPLASREALAGRLASDPTRLAAVRRSIRSARPPADLERWRDVHVAFLTDLLLPTTPRTSGRRGAGALQREAQTPMTPAVAARAVRGLQDVAVRDTVLLRLIECPTTDRGPWHRTMDLLGEVVRCAPEGAVAPPATLLGIVAWMTGEGALATVALDRAQDDNPWYRLADLTRQLISRGIDPAVWRRSMSGLTEAQCRAAGTA